MLTTRQIGSISSISELSFWNTHEVFDLTILKTKPDCVQFLLNIFFGVVLIMLCDVDKHFFSSKKKEERKDNSLCLLSVLKIYFCLIFRLCIFLLFLLIVCLGLWLLMNTNFLWFFFHCCLQSQKQTCALFLTRRKDECKSKNFVQVKWDGRPLFRNRYLAAIACIAFERAVYSNKSITLNG